MNVSNSHGRSPEGNRNLQRAMTQLLAATTTPDEVEAIIKLFVNAKEQEIERVLPDLFEQVRLLGNQNPLEAIQLEVELIEDPLESWQQAPPRPGADILDPLLQVLVHTALTSGTTLSDSIVSGLVDASLNSEYGVPALSRKVNGICRNTNPDLYSRFQLKMAESLENQDRDIALRASDALHRSSLGLVDDDRLMNTLVMMYEEQRDPHGLLPDRLSQLAFDNRRVLASSTGISTLASKARKSFNDFALYLDILNEAGSSGENVLLHAVEEDPRGGAAFILAAALQGFTFEELRGEAQEMFEKLKGVFSKDPYYLRKIEFAEQRSLNWREES